MANSRRIASYLILSTVAAAQTPVRVLPLQSRTAHVQGIDTDGVHLWVTSVDRAARKGYLQEFAVADGRLERSRWTFSYHQCRWYERNLRGRHPKTVSDAVNGEEVARQPRIRFQFAPQFDYM